MEARGEEDSVMDDGQLSFDSLTARKVSEVGSIQPVQDFEAMLARRDSDEWVLKAIREMKKLIIDFLDSAYKGNTYEKTMACLSALRKGCVEQEVNPLAVFLSLVIFLLSSKGLLADNVLHESRSH